jgi:hypothetical protein
MSSDRTVFTASSTGGDDGWICTIHCNWDRKGWVVTGQFLLLLRQEEMMDG